MPTFRAIVDFGGKYEYLVYAENSLDAAHILYTKASEMNNKTPFTIIDISPAGKVKEAN